MAFNPLPLISNNSASILSNASNQNPADYLAAGLDPTIVAGFTAQKQSLVARLAENTVAAYEIINNNAGSLTVAVMHPFSRGTCYIQSADPFQPPAIDPRWLTNPVDRQVLIEALLFNRQILATPPMVELQAAQFVPPVDADEEALNQVINSGVRTEYHLAAHWQCSHLSKAVLWIRTSGFGVSALCSFLYLTEFIRETSQGTKCCSVTLGRPENLVL